MKFLFLPILALVLFLVSSCYKGETVDLIVHNARIYSVDSDWKVYEAMAIRDGKIVELGAERQILNKYAADESFDAGGKEIYPGFIDAHAHIFSLAKQRLGVDLTGTSSMDELLARCEKYESRTQKKFIVGSGWDQASWGESELPTNARLTTLFPTIPVALFRVDGHAVLINDCLMKKLGIDENTAVEGGIFQKTDGKCTGLLMDNAMNAVYAVLPKYSNKELEKAIEMIQNELYQYGITGVHEAGITREELSLLQKMVKKDALKINLYAMLSPTEANIQFAQKNGIYQLKNLFVRSFKVIGDGALGSRGACLKEPYSDAPGHFGVLTCSIEKMNEIAQEALRLNYQLNVHAIGDSTNKIVLDLFAKAQAKKVDHRWRLEHAQVLSLADIARLNSCGAFPSVQPTHAVSDQRWAEARLGSHRIEGAYAYRKILNEVGILALGTDFPIESMNPFATIFAATQRKNNANEPKNGFYPNEALTLEECIRGMTLWAAMAAFQDEELGSLEVNKQANFVVLEKPLKNATNYVPNFAFATFINGKKVYSLE